MGAQDSPANALEKALTAFLNPGASVQREKIDKLYGFLDILDRKASSLSTVNSLLMAVNGLLIFRPPPSIDTSTIAGMQVWAYWLLPCGVVAIALSLFTVLYAVFVNSMNWPFLYNYKPGNDPTTPDPKAFDVEIQDLCKVVSQRTGHVQWQRRATLLSIVATLAAVCIICGRTWCG